MLNNITVFAALLIDEPMAGRDAVSPDSLKGIQHLIVTIWMRLHDNLRRTKCISFNLMLSIYKASKNWKNIKRTRFFASTVDAFMPCQFQGIKMNSFPVFEKFLHLKFFFCTLDRMDRKKSVITLDRVS